MPRPVMGYYTARLVVSAATCPSNQHHLINAFVSSTMSPEESQKVEKLEAERPVNGNVDNQRNKDSLESRRVFDFIESTPKSLLPSSTFSHPSPNSSTF